MKHRILFLLSVAALSFPGLSPEGSKEIRAQEPNASAKWEYLAVSLGADERAATKRLNQLAGDGWTYVGPLGYNLVAVKRALAQQAPKETAEVRGLVTLDGKPLETGTITFLANDGTPVAGGPIKEGLYTRRIPLGTFKVTIRAWREVRRPGIKEIPPIPVTEVPLPARYNNATELRVEVKAGKNELNFDLRNK